jgi:hypothetical protein
MGGRRFQKATLLPKKINAETQDLSPNIRKPLLGGRGM